MKIGYILLQDHMTTISIFNVWFVFNLNLTICIFIKTLVQIFNKY